MAHKGIMEKKLEATVMGCMGFRVEGWIRARPRDCGLKSNAGS